MPSIKYGLIVSCSVWIAALTFNVQLEDKTRISVPARKSNLSDSTLTGKQLAMQYCQGCHLFPEPALLDKKTWITSVLPNMGLRLGIREPGTDPFTDLIPEEAGFIRALNIYPDSALITRTDWDKIVKYYNDEAPSEPLPQKVQAPLISGLPQFKGEYIKLGDKAIPKTTLLKYDQSSASLYVGDAQNELYVLDSNFQVKDTWWIDTPPTDIDFPKNAPPRLLTIGVFNPSEQKTGRLMSLDKSSKEAATGINIQSLPRPVQFASGDLNMDGKEDVVICGFGNHSGKLFWYHDYKVEKEHVLKALPGARRVDIADFNRDKKPDIMVLMAQAREEISIFYNQGGGKFKEKTLLTFPPLFGASYFELVDFNKDGFQDILVANGDNWDLSAVQKNYHGLRIYLNDKKDNFKEAWFYPLYGASKAIARDFDGDGDIDIAATSFYSDLENPEQGFVYFSNDGGLNFKTYSTPEAAAGKWLTMEAGDFDRDGDIDIVLGSYFQTFGEVTKLAFKGILEFPQLLLLRNEGRKK